ncbi:MAG: DUF2786 domain-containing protein [Patulibacter minatonensis]
MSAEKPREDIIDRILKLLAMADENSGASENERMQAAERAQRLMLEHQIEALELEQDDQGAVRFTEEEEQVNGRRQQWQTDVYFAVGAGVGIHVHQTWKVGHSHNKRIVLVGRPEAVALVRSLSRSLIVWLKSECALELAAATNVGAKASPDRWRRSFYLGAARRIGHRLTEQRERGEQQYQGTGVELVLADRAALDAHVREQHGEIGTAPARGDIDTVALLTGDAAGDRAALDRELAEEASS